MDLRGDIQFNTRVRAAAYDEARHRWEIATDDAAVTATYLITAVGCLSADNIPPFEGIDTFQGQWYHTGRWPHEAIDFTGKRVAVVGTGATAVQVVPEVAKQAAQVYVFQRTANYDLAGQNRPLDPAYVREVKANYKEIWETARASAFGFPYGVLDRSALEAVSVPAVDASTLHQALTAGTAQVVDLDWSRQYAKGTFRGPGSPFGLIELTLRGRQPVMCSQGFPFICGSKQAATLKQRDHFGNKDFQHRR